MTGLFKYYKRQSLPTCEETGLGEVTTKEVNAAVEKIVEEQPKKPGQKHQYTHFTPEQRAKIAKYASECGNTAAVRHFKKEFSTLGESTVRIFKKQYQAEVQRKGCSEEISSLPKKKRGRPLTLGELDAKFSSTLGH
jgi:hypothetical protein